LVWLTYDESCQAGRILSLLNLSVLSTHKDEGTVVNMHIFDTLFTLPNI